MNDCDQCQGNPRTEVRIKTFADGRPQYCYQCLTCGRRVGSWLARGHRDVLALTERIPFDETAEQRYHDSRRAIWHEKRVAVLEQREQESAAWWRNYNAYLRTDAWRARRKLVMDRAKGMCEGCQQRRATQVHHLSYDHVGNEFLWELVAICDTCHQRCHQDREQSRAS